MLYIVLQNCASFFSHVTLDRSTKGAVTATKMILTLDDIVFIDTQVSRKVRECLLVVTTVQSGTIAGTGASVVL